MKERTIIISESQEKLLRRLCRESIASLKQEECTEMPEHISKSEDGPSGTLAGRFRPIALTDKVEKEISVPDFNRFGKYLNGY